MLRAVMTMAALAFPLIACGGGDAPRTSGEAVPAAEAALPPPAPSQEADTARLRRLRERMVQRQLASRDIRDTAVLRVMGEVPRHRFLPRGAPELAYMDNPVPIGYGQTMSQPYIVAFMAQAAGLESGDRVLEIGTGSGYGAAVLAGLAREVYTIEIVPELADWARSVLEELDYDNVHVRTGNGWLGWPEAAPFDAVVVTAAPDEVPPALARQLAEGGTMVIPVGDVWQELRVLEKVGGRLREVESLPVRFVPMVGKPDTAR